MEADEQKRATYLNQVSKIEPENRVYIDESGMNGSEVKDRAWGKRGALIESKKSGKYYQRTNIVAGLVENKSIAPLVFYGACNTDLFNEWVKTCLLKELKPGQTVIMDNASFHKSCKTKELIESAGCSLLFLPPYSPDLNPIEQFWSNMKRWVKKRIMEGSKILDLICSFYYAPN